MDYWLLTAIVRTLEIQIEQDLPKQNLLKELAPYRIEQFNGKVRGSAKTKAIENELAPVSSLFLPQSILQRDFITTEIDN